MKSIFIVLCFALAVFAEEQQEKQEEYKNFTIIQRVGTWGLNTAIPGLGSAVIMEDWKGARIQWILFGTGAISLGLLIANGGVNTGPSSFDILGATLLMAVSISWSLNIMFNAIRSATYDNPKYIQQLSKNPNYKNFTGKERFETYALNIIPGLGSIVFMNDWAGAITQWTLVGLGGIAIANSTWSGDKGLWGSLTFLSLQAFNAYRSSTYNKPGNMVSGKYDGFHLSVLPNRNGKIMPYLLFSKEF